MKNSVAHAFVNQVLACTLGGIVLTGGVGLGAVWMRRQISQEANADKALEARLADATRRSEEASAAIATEQDDAALLRRNAQWNLGLVPPGDRLQRVNQDPVARLAAKREGGRFNDVGGTGGFNVALRH